MKRLFQLVAVLVIAVLGAQPALAGIACTMQPAVPHACAPACPMAMSGMGPTCPMRHTAPGPGCPSNCCQSSAQQNMARLSSSAKPKSRGTALLPSQPLQPITQALAAVGALPAPSNSGPPRYILIQVFRI